MSSAIRKVERQGLRNRCDSVEAFHTAWREFREKKWEGHVPRDTSKRKRHFADDKNALIVEVDQMRMIKNAIVAKVAERVAEGKKKEKVKEDE